MKRLIRVILLSIFYIVMRLITAVLAHSIATVFMMGAIVGCIILYVYANANAKDRRKKDSSIKT